MEKRPGVLLVPSAAPRWEPKAAQLDPAVKETSPLSPASPAAPGRVVVGVPAGRGFVRPLAVAAGTSDGTVTEAGGDGDQEKNPSLPSPAEPPPGE